MARDISIIALFVILAYVLFWAYAAIAQTNCTTWCDDYGYCYTECWDY